MTIAWVELKVEAPTDEGSVQKAKHEGLQQHFLAALLLASMLVGLKSFLEVGEMLFFVWYSDQTS